MILKAIRKMKKKKKSSRLKILTYFCDGIYCFNFFMELPGSMFLSTELSLIFMYLLVINNNTFHL